jgi:hypothetical protein
VKTLFGGINKASVKTKIAAASLISRNENLSKIKTKEYQEELHSFKKRKRKKGQTRVRHKRKIYVDLHLPCKPHLGSAHTHIFVFSHTELTRRGGDTKQNNDKKALTSFSSFSCRSAKIKRYLEKTGGRANTWKKKAEKSPSLRIFCVFCTLLVCLFVCFVVCERTLHVVVCASFRGVVATLSTEGEKVKR